MMTNKEWLENLDEISRIREITLKLIGLDKKVSQWARSSLVYQRMEIKYGNDIVSGMFNEWMQEERQ